VPAGKFGVTTDGIGIDFQEPPGFPHAVAFHDVLDDRDDGRLRQTRIEENGAATFGELFLADQAVEQPRVVRAVPGANADIFLASNAVLRTVFIQTTKVFQVVHDLPLRSQIPWKAMLHYENTS